MAAKQTMPIGSYSNPVKAPTSATSVEGKVFMVVGPGANHATWFGWSEVWLRSDGRLRVAFPPTEVVKAHQNPKTKTLWLKFFKETRQ